MSTSGSRSLSLLLAIVVVGGALAGPALAQESKTAALVKELTQALDQGKLDAIAAKDPSSKDGYMAALYYPGSQLLVVSARYSVPSILEERLAKKDYREVYTDLNAASIEGSKWLVMDMGADGLKARRDDTRYDTCDVGNKSVAFDGEWKKQKLSSEDEYNKLFADAEAHYVKVLTLLVAQAKKLQ
jgi:hypothetical protein